MSANDPQAARSYHEATKHSVERLREDRHFLDWENQPLPFKIYEGLEPLPLPRDLGEIAMPALQAMTAGEVGSTDRYVPDLQTLAHLLYLSAGIIREKVYPNGHRMYFRAAACTGALYHIDLYLICGALPGLDPGVYHFAPHDFSLRRLRAGDHQPVLAAATGGEQWIARAPAALVLTSTFWRNAWKYRARAYRHCYWDSGTILANLLATAAAQRVPARVVMGFVDPAVEQLIGIDGQKEVALALVSLGQAESVEGRDQAALEPISYPTARLSKHEIDYPEIGQMHVASALADPAAVKAWRSQPGPLQPATSNAAATIALPAPVTTRGHSLSRTVLRRGSARHFAQSPIQLDDLTSIVAAAAGPIPFDFAGGSAGAKASLCDAYLIVHAVEGLEPGAYACDPGRNALEPLRAGLFRREAGILGLGQELPADAAVDIYYLCALDPVLERWGARGYRAAQMEAAIRGGRVYAAAYALGLGATGLTFFDDDVTEFFSPHASGKSVMFLMAVGHPRRHVPL